MNNERKLRVAFVIATIAAISIFFTARRRISRRKHKSTSTSSCYLHSEQKPQRVFKRVLADNSYAPFKHLKLNDSTSDGTFLTGFSVWLPMKWRKRKGIAWKLYVLIDHVAQ